MDQEQQEAYTFSLSLSLSPPTSFHLLSLLFISSSSSLLRTPKEQIPAVCLNVVTFFSGIINIVYVWDEVGTRSLRCEHQV